MEMEEMAAKLAAWSLPYREGMGSATFSPSNIWHSRHQYCSGRVGTLSLKRKGKIILIQNFDDENVLDMKQKILLGKVVTCLYLPLLHVSLHVARITM